MLTHSTQDIGQVQPLLQLKWLMPVWLILRLKEYITIIYCLLALSMQQISRQALHVLELQHALLT
jgi:hypothetical protein